MAMSVRGIRTAKNVKEFPSLTIVTKMAMKRGKAVALISELMCFLRFSRALVASQSELRLLSMALIVSLLLPCAVFGP